MWRISDWIPAFERPRRHAARRTWLVSRDLGGGTGVSPHLATVRTIEVFDPALAARTRHTYAAIWRLWRVWASGHRVWPSGPPADLPAFVAALAALGRPGAADLAARWLASLRDDGRRAATLRLYARAIVSVSARAADLEILPWSLAGVVKAPRGAVATPARRVDVGAGILDDAATRAAAAALDEATSDRDRLYAAIVVTLCDTAIRTVELLRLRPCDLDPADRGFWLRGKGQETAPVWQPATRRALAALAAVAKTGDPRGPLLPHPRGERSRGDATQGIPAGACTRGIVRAAVSAYFPGLTPHALRHARLTAWADAGAPLHVLQRAARHADPSTTAGYLDTTPDRVAELVWSLED